MKNMKVSFDFNDYTITAGGRVWDSLFVDDMYIVVEDSNYDSVRLNKTDFNIVREMAEEFILDKYSNEEVKF